MDPDTVRIKEMRIRNSVKISVFQLFSFSSYYCRAKIFKYHTVPVHHRFILLKNKKILFPLTVSLIGLLDLLGSPPKAPWRRICLGTTWEKWNIFPLKIPFFWSYFFFCYLFILIYQYPSSLFFLFFLIVFNLAAFFPLYTSFYTSWIRKRNAFVTDPKIRILTTYYLSKI